MLKKVMQIGILFLLFPAVLWAQTTDTVGVAPFVIHSQEDISYLATGIPDMMADSFRNRGVGVVDQVKVSRVIQNLNIRQMDERQAKEVGRRLNLEYIIFGSLTKVGQNISMDARMVHTRGEKPTTVAFAQEVGLERVNQAVDTLAGELTLNMTGLNRVTKVEIVGNERIETDAIRRVLKTREGDVFSELTLSEDLKRIYAMDFFDDVKIEAEDVPEGKIIRFVVVERPTVVRIDISGWRHLEEQDLRDVLGYTTYTILNRRKLAESIENMKKLYAEDGYYNAKIDYTIEEIDPKKVAVEYDIDEEKRVYIEKISFVGNHAFSNWRLRQAMETKQSNFLSYVLDTGILDEDKIKKDTMRLTAFYLNHGYLKVRVGDPDVEVREDGIYITVPIVEGEQYTVSEVQITGDVLFPEETLRDELKTKEGEVFDRENIAKDLEKLTDMTADMGHAFAEVRPLMQENEEDHTVAINFTIEKKGLVYFERISIVGNDKTRDKVIRRELEAIEGGVFSSTAIRRSKLKLESLEFFESVEINQSQGSEEDKMNLEVDVTEMLTGSFSVGAGYSSYNEVFGQVGVTQKNLFGRGQTLSLKGTFGAKADEYTLSFTEPWLFDIPLTAGFDVFHNIVAYDQYDKQATGFAIRGSYPLSKYVRLSGRYLYEFIDISEVSQNAAQEIIDMKGESVTSSILSKLQRDTRNRWFNPTDGSDNWLSVEHAGGLLGGDNAFDRFILNSGWYFPLWSEETAIYIRGRGGYIVKGDGDLPTYEKFFLGGINSVRGFEWSDISPRDPVTGNKIGGEIMAFMNVEFIFPIATSAGLAGVVFFDQGNVYTEDQGLDLGDMKRSFGAGVRYKSPLGPLRLEYGRVINPGEDDPAGNWEFSIGGFF